MLVRKKEESVQDLNAVTNLQSLQSWVRKIEQSTASVSSRLLAVERRLSGGSIESESTLSTTLQGPIEKIMSDKKKRTTGEIARILDCELTVLHNELVHEGQHLNCVNEQLECIGQKNIQITKELQDLQTSVSQLKTKLELRREKPPRQAPIIMRLGTMQIPLEVSGIISGLLMFLIAGLVAFNQKEILLSPVFLSLVGFLLIGSALLKTVRSITQDDLRAFTSMPLSTPSTQKTTCIYQQEDS